GLALIFTPAFTSGLNPLPPHLYSHGSAMLSTLQQVAGGAGTALLVGVLQAGTVVSQRPDGTTVTDSIPGVHAAFVTATVIGALVLVLTFFMRRGEPRELSRTGGRRRLSAPPGPGMRKAPAPPGVPGEAGAFS
ncbi:hypothetical protein QT621_27110, partial [Xanthomonas citri pv. citri]